MKVGAYIDGFNLYYGGRRQLGKTPGWRWLDIRALLTTVVEAQRSWPGATIDRIVYCTARIDQGSNPAGYAEQDAYLRALAGTKNVDHIEYGRYVKGVRIRPLAVPGSSKGSEPILVTAGGPVTVTTSAGEPVPNATFLVTVLQREEKGSDVNVAAHLLADVLQRRVDAAVVVSNDSDLTLAIRMARERLSVGLINPQGGLFAGALTGRKTDGVGGHWWRKLGPGDFTAHQLPYALGSYTKPVGW